MILCLFLKFIMYVSDYQGLRTWTQILLGKLMYMVIKEEFSHHESRAVTKKYKIDSILIHRCINYNILYVFCQSLPNPHSIPDIKIWIMQKTFIWYKSSLYFHDLLWNCADIVHQNTEYTFDETFLRQKAL